ncbi:MAG: hypothetical protein C4337_07585 [Armatimonadota bacterium]
MTVRAISKVAEAYKRDKSKKPSFRSHGAIAYDQRVLSWKGTDRVSILTLRGRQIVPVVFGGYQTSHLKRIRGHADLIYRDGTLRGGPTGLGGFHRKEKTSIPYFSNTSRHPLDTVAFDEV